RQDEDVVLAACILRLDCDAQGLGELPRLLHDIGRPRRRRQRETVGVQATRVSIEVLDEARRRVRVEMVDERFVADMDLFARDERRHWNNNCELLWLPFTII